MKAFFAAVRFLTVLPVPQALAGGNEDLEQGAAYFPVVGLLIGILAWGAASLLSGFFPDMLTCAMVVMLLVLASGGLHMDGLADTMDGFLSSRPRDRVLEIMRDSRIGTMGVLAVVGIILLKLTALLSVPEPARRGVILLMPLAGRCSLLVSMAALSYVREEGGLGTVFNQDHGALIRGAILGAGLLLLTSTVVCGLMGLVTAGVSLAAALAFCAYSHRKIGGYTGDTLGAGCEVVELMPALVAAAWGHGGW